MKTKWKVIPIEYKLEKSRKEEKKYDELFDFEYLYVDNTYKVVTDKINEIKLEESYFSFDLINKKCYKITNHSIKEIDRDDKNYIYIDSDSMTFYKLSKNKRQIININREYFHINAFDDKWYMKQKSSYFNVDTIFESFISIGKGIIEKFQINHINDISLCYHNNKKEMDDLIEKWLEVNPYPYKEFNPNFAIDFILDCVKLYYIYDIHKWLCKIHHEVNDKEKEEYDKKNSKYNKKEEIKVKVCSLNNALKKIDLQNCTENNLNSLILNMPDSYNPLVDYEILTNLENNADNFSKEELKEVCNICRRNLVGYVSLIQKSRYDEFSITSLQPYFKASSNKYSTIKTATSLIGAAYDRLMLDIGTSEVNIKRGICYNPNCNNQFVRKKGRVRIYCESRRCQNLRHNINVQNNKS